MHQPFSPACYAILVRRIAIANCQISKRKQQHEKVEKMQQNNDDGEILLTDQCGYGQVT